MRFALERGARFRHGCFPLKKPKSTPMSLAGLMGADHAFYYERARVLLPFRSVARTYLGETAFHRLREHGTISILKFKLRRPRSLARC
jgi:hypothetical protein